MQRIWYDWPVQFVCSTAQSTWSIDTVDCNCVVNTNLLKYTIFRTTGGNWNMYIRPCPPWQWHGCQNQNQWLNPVNMSLNYRVQTPDQIQHGDTEYLLLTMKYEQHCLYKAIKMYKAAKQRKQFSHQEMQQQTNSIKHPVVPSTTTLGTIWFQTRPEILPSSIEWRVQKYKLVISSLPLMINITWGYLMQRTMFKIVRKW